MMTAVVRWTITKFGNIYFFIYHVILVKPGPFPDYQIYLRTARFPSQVALLTNTNLELFLPLHLMYGCSKKTEPTTTCADELETSWQVNRTLVECNRQMLQCHIACDVTFSVGPTQVSRRMLFALCPVIHSNPCIPLFLKHKIMLILCIHENSCINPKIITSLICICPKQPDLSSVGISR